MGNVNGLVARFNRPLRDFKGQKLCESCWNGNHFEYATRLKTCDYHKAHRDEDPTECPDCKWVDTGKKISKCLGDPCECHCKELVNEAHPRIKKDFSSQVNIAEVVGDDVIQIGNPQNPTVSHRDDS